MKKLLTIVFLMATSLMAKAQNSAVSGYCTLGATSALISGLPSLNTLQGIVPGCTVTVYLSGTQTPATIYATSGGQALGNPFSAVVAGLPNAGSYLFYAAQGVAVDIVLSGGTSPNVYQTPVTLTGVNPGGGGSVAGVSQILAGSGISLSPTGGTGAVTVTATGGGGGPSTPSAAVTGLGVSTGSIVAGDSTACSTGATATTVGGVYMSAVQNSYPGLLKSIIGGDQMNDCYPGTTETDINNFTFFHADNQGVGSPTFFGEGFINDATNANATSANYQASQKYGLQAQVLFRALPRANKTFAQDGSITTTGTWVSDTAYQPAWGISSTTNGSTFSCPATIGADGHGIVWALIKDGNGGTWTGSWSGTGGGAMTDPVTSSSTFNATGYGGVAMAGLTFNSQYVAYIVSGLSAGAHTFTGTVTSTTGAGNVVDFGGCAGLPAANTNLPWDFEAGVPYQNSGTGGAADSTTAAYNTIVSGLVTTLSALPLNVGFVDVRNSLLNATACGNGVEATMFTNCYADFKHLNNLGYSTEVIQPATGYAAVVTTANPALALGGLKNPRLGPMFEYPNLPAPKDTSRWYNFNATYNGHGYGAIFNCANGGQNCDGIGDLQNYGLSLVMGGNVFNLINQTGSTVTPTNTSTATQFITATPNGALCFFGTNGGCNSNPFTYFTSNVAYIGGLPGYPQAGSWLTSVVSGVATQTAAVSGTNQNSYQFRFRGTYWNGTANQPADVYLFNAVGTGTSPTSMLTLGGQYAGTFGVDFSAATQQNKYGNGLFSSLYLSTSAATFCLHQLSTGQVLPTASDCGSGGGLTSFTTGNLSPIFTASLGGSPTTSPALAFTLSNAAQNAVLAGPATGGAGAPTYRALVLADVPTVGTGTLPPCKSPTTAPTASDVLIADSAGCASDSGKPLVASGTVAGEVVIWTSGAIFAPTTISGDCTLDGTGAMLCPKVNGIVYNSVVSAVPTVTPTLNVNLLQYTGNLATYWTAGAMTTVTGSQSDENSVATATLYVPNTTNVLHTITFPMYLPASTSTQPLAGSFYAKASGATGVAIELQVGGTRLTSQFNLSSCAVSSSATGFTWTGATSTNGYCLFTFTYTIAATQIVSKISFFPTASGGSTTTYAGDGTSGIILSHPEVSVTSTVQTYQDVTGVHRYCAAAYNTIGVSGGCSPYVTAASNTTNPYVASEVNSITVPSATTGIAYYKIFRTGGATQGALIVSGSTQLAAGTVVNDNLLTADGTTPPNPNSISTPANPVTDTRPMATEIMSYNAINPYERTHLLVAEPGLAGTITNVEVSITTVDQNYSQLILSCPGQSAQTFSFGTFFMAQDNPTPLGTNRLIYNGLNSGTQTFTATTVTGSNALTGVSSTLNLDPRGGWVITGTGIPNASGSTPGTVVQPFISGATTLYMSQNATASGTVTLTDNTAGYISAPAINTTSGSTAISGIPGAIGVQLSVGQGIQAAGIPAGAFIAALPTANTITLDSAHAATATASGVTAYFPNMGLASFHAARSTEIPFTSGCTLDYLNNKQNSFASFFADVTYKLGQFYTNPKRKVWHAVETPLTQVTSQQTVNIVPTLTSTGGGEAESFTLFASPSATNYVQFEGNPTIFADGNMALTSNGTEDFFGGGFYFQSGQISLQSDRTGNFIGSHLYDQQQPGDALMYRFFGGPNPNDNVLFQNSFQVTWQWGELGVSTPGLGYYKSLFTYWTAQ